MRSRWVRPWAHRHGRSATGGWRCGWLRNAAPAGRPARTSATRRTFQVLSTRRCRQDDPPAGKQTPCVCLRRAVCRLLLTPTKRGGSMSNPVSSAISRWAHCSKGFTGLQMPAGDRQKGACGPQRLPNKISPCGLTMITPTPVTTFMLFSVSKVSAQYVILPGADQCAGESVRKLKICNGKREKACFHLALLTHFLKRFSVIRPLVASGSHAFSQ